MKTTRIPDWLKKILEVSGLEQGKYSFGEDSVELEQLPDEFVGVAECEGGGLAVAKKADGILYRFEDGKVNVYATSEEEFRLEIRRDEAWEELSENMPATKPFWLGIVIKSNNEDGEEMTLGFKGSSRDSVMVIQGKMLSEELLSDALHRELSEALEITDYQIIDVLDDGGEYEDQGQLMPLFTVVVGVETFDPEVMGDPRIGWVRVDRDKAIN
jgi:hypothetical protein